MRVEVGRAEVEVVREEVPTARRDDPNSISHPPTHTRATIHLAHRRKFPHLKLKDAAQAAHQPRTRGLNSP